MRTNNFSAYEITCKLVMEESLRRNQEMNVAISITQDYILYAYVMLTSLLENHAHRKINIYILYNNIPDEQLSLFEELENKYGQTIICQNIPDEWIPSELPTPDHWPKEIYFRCYLPAILPDTMQRVLYLDTDTIINRPLDALYDISFMGHSLVVCSDQSVADSGLTPQQTNLFSQIEGFHPDDYFNSGVILFNLEKIRSNITVPEILDTAVELKDFLFAPDQDLLNLLFQGDVSYEDALLYNCFARLQFNQGYDLEKIRNHSRIVHFAGRKPWTGEAVRYNTERLWWEYAAKLPRELYCNLLESFVFSEIDSNFVNNAIIAMSNEKKELLKALQKAQSES